MSKGFPCLIILNQLNVDKRRIFFRKRNQYHKLHLPKISNSCFSIFLNRNNLDAVYASELYGSCISVDFSVLNLVFCVTNLAG